MKLLDIESKPGNWRYLAECLGASYLDVQFLESRNRESPTQHVLNVFETMNKPLTFLRDVFIDLDRHDVVTVLNDEINWCQIGHWSGNEPTLLPLLLNEIDWIRNGCLRHKTARSTLTLPHRRCCCVKLRDKLIPRRPLFREWDHKEIELGSAVDVKDIGQYQLNAQCSPHVALFIRDICSWLSSWWR